jgi:hypothetical protein
MKGENMSNPFDEIGRMAQTKRTKLKPPNPFEEVGKKVPEPAAENGIDRSPPPRKPNKNGRRVGLWIGLGIGVFILILATVGATLWATGSLAKQWSKANAGRVPRIMLSEQQKAAAADAIKALDRVKAAVEVGVTFQKYSELVIDAKAAVNEAERTLPNGDIVANLSGAVQAYKDVVAIWNRKIQRDVYYIDDRNIIERYKLPTYKGAESSRNAEIEVSMQIIWAFAAEKLANARSCL